MKSVSIKIYIDSEDRVNDTPTWQYIIKECEKEGIAGATVYKAIAGIGSHSQLHTFNILSISQNLPIVIEIIDTKNKIDKFIKRLKEYVKEGILIKQEVELLNFKDV